MIHYVFVAATWLIGVVGVGGAVVTAVAVVYLGPATVMAIVRPIFAKFLACTKCVVAVVFVLSTTAAYWVGHHQAETQCRADELNSKLAAERADTAAQVKAAADEANRAIEIEVTAKDQHDQDLRDIAALKSRPATCAFDDVDSGGNASRGVLSKFRPAQAKSSGRAK